MNARKHLDFGSFPAIPFPSMISMNDARMLMAVVLVGPLTACVSTTRPDRECDQRYVLREDVHLYGCSTWTGSSSVWFTGPQRTETICSAKIPVAGARVLKRGSPVRVLKLINVSAMNTSSREAQLEIVDVGSKAAHVVHVKWPWAKALLATE